MATGWVVALTTASGGYASQWMQIFDTAVEDAGGAVAAVKAHLGQAQARPGETFEALEPLSESAVAGLGLESGEVRERRPHP